jgi:hypothetical protein
MLQPNYIEMIHGNAFPAVPFERMLFYRDDLHEWFLFNGIVWVGFAAVLPHHLTHELGGADQVMGTAPAIPLALVHRDAAGRAQIVNPAVNGDIDNMGARNAAIEAHRAGAVHTLPQPPMAHEATHEWLGTDELDIELLYMNLVVANEAWLTMDAWTTWLVGTGLVTWSGITNMRCSTGAVINSIASIYDSVLTIQPPFAGYIEGFYIRPRTATTTSEIWLTLRRSTIAGNTFPTLTEDHAGFRILNGEIYASNGNGVAGTQTDTGINVGLNAPAKVLIIGGGAVLYFYVNEVLLATHNTNLPLGWTYYPWCGIKNTAGIDRTMQIINCVFNSL